MGYNVFDEINKLPILDLLDKLGIGYMKNGAGYVLKHPDGRKDTSFSIKVSDNIITDFGKSGIKGGVFDFIGQYHLGLSEAEMRQDIGRATTVKFFVDKGFVTPPEVKREFIKSVSLHEIYKNFNDYKLNGYKDVISSFLLTRGVSYDTIKKENLLIGEIFKDIGYYDNYYCTEHESFKDQGGEWQNKKGDNPRSVGIFLFPCYDEDKNLIGMKIRRKDGRTIRGKKSLALGVPSDEIKKKLDITEDPKTGLLYDVINKSSMIIVEGEMDYIILRLLGYKNVVANEGGVQSHKEMLKNLLAETAKIICLYDNDTAGINGKLALAETFGRPIEDIMYPVREDRKGRNLADVNDFYKVGYNTKAKWATIFTTCKIVGSEIKEEDTRFILLDKGVEFYDTKWKQIIPESKVMGMLQLNKKELFQATESGIIKIYNDLCYHEGGMEGFYNTMNEEVIIKHGGNAQPILHPHIEILINNICNDKKINIEWLHKAILYKLTHINDPYVPALILYGEGGSGKGTLLNLLSKIFGEDNMQTGLGQKDLEGSFDSYQGNKLIVEYKEVSSGHKRDDKKITDRIKSILNEKTINVRALYQNAKTVDNKAWFHFSSNHVLPLHLDSKHSGNRRFTVVKTGGKLDATIAREMNEVIFKDKQVIKEYVSWLYNTYPDIPKSTTFLALNNPEKRQLEINCEGVANLFFEWLEEKYSDIWKITNKEKNILLGIYCNEIGENVYDKRFNQSNFDSGLSHRYEKKSLKIRGKGTRGYLINKTDYDKQYIPVEAKGEFKEGQVERMESGTF